MTTKTKTKKTGSTRSGKTKKAGAGVARDPEDSLGSRIRRLRYENRWTLDHVAKMTGVAPSTISKLENNQVDITFETLMRLCDGLNLSLEEITGGKRNTVRGGVRTINYRGKGLKVDTPCYGHEILSSEIFRKGIVPSVVTIKSRTLDDEGVWSSHLGEEFIYVLQGEIELHTEFYEATRLGEGDSTHYDSEMHHAIISVSKKEAIVLSVSHNPTSKNNDVMARISRK